MIDQIGPGMKVEGEYVDVDVNVIPLRGSVFVLRLLTTDGRLEQIILTKALEGIEPAIRHYLRINEKVRLHISIEGTRVAAVVGGRHHICDAEWKIKIIPPETSLGSIWSPGIT